MFDEDSEASYLNKSYLIHYNKRITHFSSFPRFLDKFDYVAITETMSVEDPKYALPASLLLASNNLSISIPAQYLQPGFTASPIKDYICSFGPNHLQFRILFEIFYMTS
ncbi:MAG: hypothetical protein ACTHME_00915 [Candidatus Nitrosocosmicus sp.]